MMSYASLYNILYWNTQMHLCLWPLYSKFILFESVVVFQNIIALLYIMNSFCKCVWLGLVEEPLWLHVVNMRWTKYIPNCDTFVWLSRAYISADVLKMKNRAHHGSFSHQYPGLTDASSLLVADEEWHV